MLTELYIRDFALIDELRLHFGPGFNVLTGETGAGKSIIVDAMATVLGERAGSEVVRTGSAKCIIQAVFDLSNLEEATRIATELGFEPEDGLLTLTREIPREGRSTCRINGRMVPSSIVREITCRLIDLHGQHEHQSLLSATNHLDIFDAWVGPEAQSLKEKTKSLWTDLKQLLDERERLQSDERERARLLDLYKYQLEEILSANLRPGEEEELLAERNLLANAEKLSETIAQIYILTGADEAAVDKLGRATAAAEKILAIDPGFATIAETLQASLAAAQDFVLAIREYQDHIEINPTRLEQVEDRLEQIRRLKRKYGDTIGEILTYASEIQAKIEELDKTEERLENIQKHIECVQSGLRDKCDRLSAIRKNSAPEFAALVERELADLAMNKARFEVSIAQCEPGPKGADVVEFLISPNPGEPVKPLAKIASGGEISRIMLALKTVVKRSYTPVLVFDEIDAGIGGITAQTLGDKLSSLALSCQVLCVTHLPQVASRADSQFAVEKVATGNRTVVKARKLEGEERVREIARMLGGDARSETAMAHARELLERAGRSRTCA